MDIVNTHNDNLMIKSIYWGYKIPHLYHGIGVVTYQHYLTSWTQNHWGTPNIEPLRCPKVTERPKLYILRLKWQRIPYCYPRVNPHPNPDREHVRNSADLGEYYALPGSIQTNNRAKEWTTKQGRELGRTERNRWRAASGKTVSHADILQQMIRAHT